MKALKKVILDQDAFIVSREYYEALAHFDGDDENTLKVVWEILPNEFYEDEEVIERQPEEDCNWDAPVYIVNDDGVNIYDGYYDDEKFDKRFELIR